MILATYSVLPTAVRKIASWFVSFESDYICRTIWNNVVKLHVTISFVSCYIYIYIYIYIYMINMTNIYIY